MSGAAHAQEPALDMSMDDAPPALAVTSCSGGSSGSGASGSGVRPRSSSRLSQYDVGAPIGSGKYSTVFCASDRRTGERVALKRVQIFSIMDKERRADCVNEVRSLQTLEHPNIVRYVDSFLEDNELAIVLEWADAGDVGKLLARVRGEECAGGAGAARGGVGAGDVGASSDGGELASELLPEHTIWSVLRQAASGLAHMHSRRVMHRDLKPSNVFLGSDGTVKLGDLGLSRVMSSKTVELQSMVGTPFYMSPEVIRGKPYDFASDVWSLGCLAYEMAALRSPFDKPGLNYYTLGRAIVNCAYDALPAARSSERIERFVKRCLQADPKNRASAAELVALAEEAEAALRVSGAGCGVWGGCMGGEEALRARRLVHQGASPRVDVGPWMTSS